MRTRLSLISASWYNQLVVAFTLMAIVPLLTLGYFLSTYVLPFVQTHENTALVLVLNLILALAGFLLMRGILKSFQRLRENLESVTQGDLQARLEPATSEEMTNIARSVEIIIDRLQQDRLELQRHSEELERLVGVRTAELRAANEALQAEVRKHEQAETVLHDVLRRLHRSQDEERRRIGRELHDSTAQRLAAVVMNLERLGSTLQQASPAELQLLAGTFALVEQSVQEVRTLSYLLHPPLLDQMGLASALGCYLDGFSARSGIPVEITVEEGIGRLPNEVEIGLFRVVQESLGNIHRHSGCRTAEIRLRTQDGNVIVEVQDDGKGMATTKMKAIRQGAPGGGVGIAGMRERLQVLGGRLEIESDANGTTVRAIVPIAAGGKTP
jgi:signal transduction histidine kinase